MRRMFDGSALGSELRLSWRKVQRRGGAGEGAVRAVGAGGRGARLAEYALLFVLVVVVAIIGLAVLGVKVHDKYHHVANNL